MYIYFTKPYVKTFLPPVEDLTLSAHHPVGFTAANARTRPSFARGELRLFHGTLLPILHQRARRNRRSTPLGGHGEPARKKWQ